MQGLQVWDASGNLILDVGNRVLVLQGQVFTGTSGGSVTVSNSNGTIWYIVQGFDRVEYARPYFSVSGDTISWGSSVSSVSLFYGTY